MERSDYEDVLSSLYALQAAKGMDFKLERVALALKNLGNPQSRYPTVHVAGTNGKGSVAAMSHAILSAAGYRVGLYTSPHLVSFTERMRIGDALIDEATVVELTQEIRAAATVRGIDLTFFEFVTVMAFLYFAHQSVDLAIVEAGLGGRLDATNVLDPEVSVITTIGLDHQEFLGATVQLIAAEKAGVIKPGRPVVIGDVPAEVRPILARVAEERRAPAYWATKDFAASVGATFRFTGLGCEFSDLLVRLHGAYQRQNAAVAIAAALHLRPGFRVTEHAIRRGLASVCWPGRLDLVQSAPMVILDGAHNRDGVTTLVRELPAIASDRRIRLLFGVMRDKDWRPMIDVLGPRVERVIVTTVLPPRGERGEVLAEAFAAYTRVRVVSDPHDGLRELLADAGEHDAILVAGSLFLIGQVYPYFLRRSGHQGLFGAPAVPLPA